MRKAQQASKLYVFVLAMIVLKLPLQAQTDTAQRQGIDSFLLKQKGIIGDLAKNLVADTTQEPTVNGLQRNDRPFQRHRGKIIRNIRIQSLDFGVSIRDTSKGISTNLTRLANNFHRKSREYVIRKNLFFSPNEPLVPYLMADNERHLRDQEFLQDALIIVTPVRGSRDSVDVTVRTKDVFSIGGSFRIHNLKSMSVQIKEDNLAGMGDRFAIRSLYDNERRQKFGFGAEYIARNIGGSFTDGYAGILNFQDAFNSGQEEETIKYLRFIRPMVNPYTRWTYAAEVADHYTSNMFASDSLYESDLQYKYYNIDAWVGLNMSVEKLTVKNYEGRLRKMIGLRFIQQHFDLVPGKFEGAYNWEYANLTALLASFSIFRQEYYKTQYIYGFGRNEDVPEGIDVSLTSGWTKKDDRERPYIGLDFQRYYFTTSEHYFNYTARVGGYLYQKHLQDIDVLLNLDYFSKLRQIGKKWKQRSFLGAGVGRQINKSLNQPLFLRNQFGLPEYDHGELPGDTRISLRSESVFFSPLNFINFRFAPFVFGNVALFTAEGNKFSDSKLYSSIGGGIRTRNEALIFGTLELKAYYFPRKNFLNESYRIEFNSNVRFRYNRQFIKRPEFVTVN
ncbi:MAG TPA: hypothetical protein VGD17_13695 [Chitinophagaceae bacterium]